MKNKRFIIYLMPMGTENDFENLDLLKVLIRVRLVDWMEVM
jgi:hypothetical protein